MAKGPADFWRPAAIVKVKNKCDQTSKYANVNKLKANTNETLTSETVEDRKANDNVIFWKKKH